MTIADMSTRAVERTLICTPVGRDAQLLLEMLKREILRPSLIKTWKNLPARLTPPWMRS